MQIRGSLVTLVKVSAVARGPAMFNMIGYLNQWQLSDSRSTPLDWSLWLQHSLALTTWIIILSQREFEEKARYRSCEILPTTIISIHYL